MSTGRTAERSAAAPTERSERRREGTGGQFGYAVTILDAGAAGVVGAANWTERTIVAPTPLLCRVGGSAGVLFDDPGGERYARQGLPEIK